MNWTLFEDAFMNAWSGALTKRKWLMTFIALSLCGVLVVFCRALALEASSWVRLSLLFCPFFLSSCCLWILGVLLVRIYTHEKRGLYLSTTRLLVGSVTTAIGTSYLSFPSMLAYLFLWIALGLFFLLKEIPYMGSFFHVVLAFGPFLLIFSSLLLCLFNVLLLFFIVPPAAHQSVKNIHFLLQSWKSIAQKPFLSLLLFFVGILPALAIGGLLSVAAILTDLNFSLATPTIALALKWFFIMLPFCALLSPAVLFFFHFAAESHKLLQEP